MERRNNVAEEKKKSRSDKFYGKPPKAERSEDGKLEVKKPEKGTESDKNHTSLTSPQAGTEGVPVEVRHGMERHAMMGRHEMEHGMADKMGHKDKKEMHERHESEMKSMHTRHEKEISGKEAASGEK